MVVTLNGSQWRKHSVLSWMVNKAIDMFSKKLIFVPIHQNQHWSLMVAVNAGLIDFCDELNVVNPQ